MWFKNIKRIHGNININIYLPRFSINNDPELIFSAFKSNVAILNIYLVWKPCLNKNNQTVWNKENFKEFCVHVSYVIIFGGADKIVNYIYLTQPFGICSWFQSRLTCRIKKSYPNVYLMTGQSYLVVTWRLFMQGSHILNSSEIISHIFLPTQWWSSCMR